MRFKYFATAIAAITLAGCSNNDDVLVDNNEIANEEGKSYLSISLVTDGSAISRGTSGGYEEGQDNDENGVSSVGFIFFDANGDNHSHVLYTINNGTTSIDAGNKHESIADLGENDGFNFKDDDEDQNNTPGKDNIEKISDAVIVFKNLTNNSTPRKVLALLNISADDFKNIKSKNESDILPLSNGDNTGVKFKNGNGFIMSNSAYVNENEAVTATAISASDFKTDEATAKKSPVSIYVERMAAKVQLTRASNVTEETELPVQTGEATSTTNTKLTIEVVAWGLSGMNKDSYWFKDVDATWNYTWGISNSWSNANDHRSYWAKDNDYDNGTYVGDNASITGSNKDNLSLIYKSWKDYTGESKLNAGTSTYCYENTYSGAFDSSKSTNVLVLAKFKKNDNTEWSPDETWYKYNGVLYDENNYKRAALQYFKDNSDVKLSTGDLQVNDVTIKYEGDGYSVLQATLTDDATFTNGSGTATKEDFEKELAKITKATSYKNGMMYYCIPIEHLNTHTADHSKAENSTDCTGEYGVVRNHWYQLEVGNITALGKGVYDPEETIVPNDEENQFFLAAKLHILSWHIVKQTISDLNKPMM